jgi:uncharacterized secreted protein with C-terminal beta-propeller domain
MSEKITDQGVSVFRASIRGVSLTLSAAVLAACGGGSSGGGAEPAQLSGLLKPVASEEEFLAGLEAAYTTDSAQQNRDDGNATPVAESGDAALDGNASSSGYSTTYTQEANVDEIDVVKYDGEHLYIVPSLQNNCCFFIALEGDATDAGVAENDGSQTEEPAQPAIRILSTDPSTATAAEVASIPLEQGEYVQGLYLLPEQKALLTVGTETFYGGYGGFWLDIWAWHEQNVRVNYYDVSDAAHPVNDWEIELEGGFVESRRVGNTVYLVSRHTPTIDNIYYYPTTAQEFEANRNTFQSLDSEDVIPTLTIRGPQGEQSRELFAPEDCLVTNEDVVNNDKAGYPTLTSITAISLDDPLNPQTVCYNESAAGLYMSDNALYLTDVRYSAETSVTRIHKFALGEGKPQYRGSAEVSGYLWTGGQKDFRISEYDGYLRLVTSVWTGDEADRQDHILHILKQADSGTALEEVSQLPNSARPAEIGKPNEALYGVRFVGERAYAVTFEQIDPLYVLDLSNPEDPFIAGSIDLPGFSDFLHPIGDDLLLGLGTSTPESGGRQVKLELFDVSAPTAPVSRGSLLLGAEGDWNWSEAQYNRHAFSYLSGDGSDRFTVPVQSSGSTPEGGYYSNASLYLMEVNNTGDASAASLDAAGSILADYPGSPYWYGGYRHRSVIDGDAVYFIADDDVWSALWDSPDTVNGPQ